MERCIDDELPFEIPDSWEWVRLGTVFQHNTGKALNASNRDGEKLTYITTSNLYWDRFVLDNLKTMPFTDSEVDKCTVQQGDLLVCEGGDIGRAAIWGSNKPMRIQNHIHRLAEKEYGKLIVFLDCHSKLDTFFSFLLLSLGIGVLCVLVVFFLVSVLSKQAIKPIVQNMENQKRFITDAGHEIKTPLSIISANADVLELTGGKNEWVDSIRNQTMRLDGLVQDLLTLSQMEEDQSEYAFSPVSLSDMVETVAASFRTVAFSRQISFSVSVEKDIVIDAQENSIRKLLSVLIDNAVKYAGSSGWVVIRLWAEEKVVHLDILNSCENVEKLDFQKLFDRFYCADQSRSRVTGGYGIGLSIAKAMSRYTRQKLLFGRKGKKESAFLSFSRSRKKIVRRKNSWDNPAVFLVILIPDSLGSIE